LNYNNPFNDNFKMHFATSVLAVVASAAAAQAAAVTFQSLDNRGRTVYFTPSPGSPEIPSVHVDGGASQTVQFPDTYEGNFYAVIDGRANTPGMLGEVKFGGWGALNYFDVSAIVDPNDKNNIKEMYPASAGSPISGCENFPCNNAYYLPDDIQTKSTTENHIITTLGG
jgi:hypothetical protein